MFWRPKVLIDVRESETLRGYHALAVAQILARDCLPLRWFCLTSGHAEERLAMASFGFDAKSPVETWDGRRGFRGFRLYLLISQGLPDDAQTEAAMKRSAATLLGLTFADAPPVRPGLVAMSGHDTAALAETARRLIASPRARQ